MTFRDLRPSVRCLTAGSYAGALRVRGEKGSHAVWFCPCAPRHETFRAARECAERAVACDDGSLMAEELNHAMRRVGLA